MSMNSAQYRYDRQTPEDKLPHEPSDQEVQDWIEGDGHEMLHNIFVERNYASWHVGQDFVQWIESNYDTIVDWYIEDNEKA